MKKTMIAPMDNTLVCEPSTPMEKLSPILNDELTKISTRSSSIKVCRDNILPRNDTTHTHTNRKKGLKPFPEFTSSPCHSMASRHVQKNNNNNYIKENIIEESPNTFVSPLLLPVTSSLSLRRLKRKLFLQRVSASETSTPRTSTASSSVMSGGYDSTRASSTTISSTSTRSSSSSSIQDEEIRKMLVERLFRTSLSHK